MVPTMSSSLAEQIPDRVDAAAAVLLRVDAGRRRVPAFALGDGVIATSSRALPPADAFRATTHDGTELSVTLVGRDPGTDVAILRADDWTGTAPTFRDPSSLRLGELVLAVGRGERMRSALASIGLLADGITTPSGSRLDRVVELDRDLPRGSSGRLVIDLHGQPVGLATRALAEVAIVVPGSTILRLAQDLAQHGKLVQGWFGVGVAAARLPRPLRDTLGQAAAVAIVGLAEDGPGARAGLLVGDLILAIDGQIVRNPMALRAELLPRSGQTVDVRILRGGQTQDLRITAGERP
jgi:S1-C subfamily serine protease